MTLSHVLKRTGMNFLISNLNLENNLMYYTIAYFINDVRNFET